MGKARRTAEVIGAEGFSRRPPQMPVHPALLAELYLPEICQGPIRDCGRITGKQEIAPTLEIRWSVRGQGGTHRGQRTSR